MTPEKINIAISKPYGRPEDNLWIEDRECQHCAHAHIKPRHFGPSICTRKLMGILADMRVVHTGPDTSCFTPKEEKS